MAKEWLKKILSWLLRASGSAFLLWLVLRKIHFGEVTVLFEHIDWGWLAASLVVMLFNRTLSVSRVMLMLKSRGVSFHKKEVARIVLGSQLFGSFLPTSIGGDVIRFYGLARHTDNFAEAVSAVSLERITGVVSLLLLAIVGGVWVWPQLNDHRILVAALTPSIGGILLITFLMNERWMSAIARGLGVGNHQWVAKLLGWQQAAQAYQHHRAAMLRILGISVAINAMWMLSIYFAARSLGTTLPFAYFAAFVPLILLISLLPISIGGLGVRENAFVHLFTQVGMPAEMAFSTSIISHMLSVIANIPGGLWSFWTPRHLHRSEALESHARRVEPVRVLRIIDKLGYEGRLHGPGRTWLNTLGFITRDHYYVMACVLRLHPRVKEQFTERGIHVRDLRKGRFNPMTLPALIGLIRSERIDVIHAEGDGCSMFGRLAGWLTGVPVIVQYHDLSRRVPWYMRMVDIGLSGKTARAVAVGEAVAEACVLRRHLNRARISVIPNIVDPRWSAPINASDADRLRDALGVPKEVPVIGSITRFHPVKDVPTLLEAAAQLSARHANVHLVLVGDGPNRLAIEARIKALGLTGRVHLAGYQEDPRPYMALMDVVVFSSVSEGFPNAVLEAMTLGLAIVATDVGGTRELIRDGNNGLLVVPRSPQAMAAAIRCLLEDKVLAARLASQAKRDSASYSASAHVERLQRLYDEVALLPKAQKTSLRRVGYLSTAAGATP